mmetsp:Transcript_15108/g.33712  ORF Transcript_15108/g.33712 Transcript_15108/m.33712 type:complete len:105 (-) Transcript_15108:1141-1455(-)
MLPNAMYVQTLHGIVHAVIYRGIKIINIVSGGLPLKASNSLGLVKLKEFELYLDREVRNMWMRFQLSFPDIVKTNSWSLHLEKILHQICYTFFLDCFLNELVLI